MKKDRSSSGGNLEFPGSPCVSRRSHKEKQPSFSRLRINPNAMTPAQIVELTIFHIPGLDVKVIYQKLCMWFLGFHVMIFNYQLYVGAL